MSHHLITMIYIIAFLLIVSFADVDTSAVFRSRIDRCYNRKCTQRQPTCSSRFRGLSSPRCLNPQQIIPWNSTVRSVYVEKEYPVFLHTKYKNSVFMLELPSSIKWKKTKQFSPNSFLVNINVTAKTRG